METSHPLTIESFSCSWLIDQKPSIHNIFDKEENNTNPSTQNFCFSLPYAMNLVDADEIFSNGRIIPKSVNQIRVYSCPATPADHFPRKKPSKYTKMYTQLVSDLRLSSKKVIRMCLSFLVHRKSPGNSSVCVSSSVNIRNNIPTTNERMNRRIEVYKTMFRRTKSCSSSSIRESRFSENKSCDYDEGSINEAIVHCKRSYDGSLD